MASKTALRIHPTINFARFGTSEDYYLSPETSAGLPVLGTATTGGLPIKKGTEGDFITSQDLRDDSGALRRQAARFRLFAYALDGDDRYPNGGGTEVLPGSRLADGRVVRSIVWTVHLANKKANGYNVVPSQGVNAYANGRVPQLRNPQAYGTADDAGRIANLVIDPGPRAISGLNTSRVVFDARTTPSYSDGRGGIAEQQGYPQSFPTASELFQPTGPLDSLGEVRTDDKGRLLVLAAFGRTAAVYDEYGDPMALTGDLNNAGWWDDAADGPVSATVVFEDGSAEEAFGAWVVCCDPAYAPQIRNVVSVWDDVFDTWVRHLGLMPELYDVAGQVFNGGYRPAFEAVVRPIFRAAAMQRWTVNLPKIAIKAHEAVDAIVATDNPDQTIMAGLTFIRNPKAPGEASVGVPLMPLSLGDAGSAFLAVSQTQYFFLQQWSKHQYEPGHGAALGPGEALDMAALANCLGGRYVPGIELTYTIREPDIYMTDWRTSGAGPFRIKHQPLDYSTATSSTPFLHGGWIPRHGITSGLEPGDLTKFMAIPWQTDYNSCSIHQTSINTGGHNTANGNATTLYWSWPSQRPDAVYVASDVVDNVLPVQKWSIRGPGTYASDPKSASTFQKPLQAVAQWDRIGIVVQGSAIEGGQYAPDYYLEVQSQLDVPGYPDPVPAWPFNANPTTSVTSSPKASGAPRK